MALKDKYFTIHEAAKQFNVTRQTISRWIAGGKIPVEKVGRETLIKRKDLSEFYRKRLSEVAADSIVAMWLATAEDYCREKDYLRKGTKVEFVSGDRADIVRELTDEERAEVRERFRQILEGFLKDFYQKAGINKIAQESKQRGKKTK